MISCTVCAGEWAISSGDDGRRCADDAAELPDRRRRGRRPCRLALTLRAGTARNAGVVTARRGVNRSLIAHRLGPGSIRVIGRADLDRRQCPAVAAAPWQRMPSERTGTRKLEASRRCDAALRLSMMEDMVQTSV